jgi:hypothetical protein
MQDPDVVTIDAVIDFVRIARDDEFPHVEHVGRPTEAGE